MRGKLIEHWKYSGMNRHKKIQGVDRWRAMGWRGWEGCGDWVKRWMLDCLSSYPSLSSYFRDYGQRKGDERENQCLGDKVMSSHKWQKDRRLGVLGWMNLLIWTYWFSAWIFWMLGSLLMPIYVIILVLKFSKSYFAFKLVLDKYDLSFICGHYNLFCVLNSWWL